MAQDDIAVKPAKPLILASRRERYSDDEIVDRLRAASAALHGRTMSEWQRATACLLDVAASRLLIARASVNSIRADNSKVRAERDAARAGVVNADYWYCTDDEESQGDKSYILDCRSYGEIVEVEGLASVGHEYGFRLAPLDGGTDAKEREFWFPTQLAAETKLAELTADGLLGYGADAA